MAAHSFQKLSGDNMPPGIDNSPTGHTMKGKQMSYFPGEFAITPGMGFTEEINTVLMRNFHDSPYAGTGLITASNLEWLREQEFPFIRFYADSMSIMAQFVGPVQSEDSDSFGYLVEVLYGLSDYPLVSDELYSEMESKIVEGFLTELAERESLDLEQVLNFYRDYSSQQVIVESDLSAYVSSEVEFLSEFLEWDRERLARLHGAVTLDI